MINVGTKSLVIAASLIVAAANLPAQADVFIGLQEAGFNGGAITQVASSATGSAAYSGSYGTYAVNSITVTGQPLDANLLDSTALDLATSTAGTIKIYVSSTGNTQEGAGSVLSSLTSNILPAGWATTLQTYWDAADTPFALTSLLASHVFNTIGTDVINTAADLTAPFSVTGVYTVNSTSPGTALSTLHMAVPEPSTLMLLLGALGVYCWGMGSLRQDNRQV